MRLTGNTILITGGASGIGLGLTKRFLEAGNEVIICGRRPDKLMEVKERYPGVHTKVCDVAINPQIVWEKPTKDGKGWEARG